MHLRASDEYPESIPANGSEVYAKCSLQVLIDNLSLAYSAVTGNVPFAQN